MSKRDNVPFALKLVRWGFPKLEKLAPPLAQRYFIRLFFTPLRYRRPEKENEFVDSAEKTVLTVAGKKIQVYAWGAKTDPMILVVHGWAGRATQFRKFIPELTKAGYRVVGFDGPAHGLSEGKQTNILEFDEVLKALFNEVGIPKAIITHSFGGVAVLYAITKGLPVTTLVNIASPTIGDEVINTYLRAINGSPSTGDAFKKWMVDAYHRTFDEFSGTTLLRQLPTPVRLLLVYDSEDQEVTIAHAEAALKVYPQAVLLRTNGLGHNRILKEPAVIERCIGFISSPL